MEQFQIQQGGGSQPRAPLADGGHPFLDRRHMAMGQDLHRQPGFLVGSEQTDLSDLPQIHPDRIVG